MTARVLDLMAALKASLAGTPLPVPSPVAQLNAERDAYHALFGRAGQVRNCTACGRLTDHRPDASGDFACTRCIEERIGQMADAIPARCSICSSSLHDACGFCASCHEHCTFQRDEAGDVLSDCCGASGHAYDYDPS